MLLEVVDTLFTLNKKTDKGYNLCQYIVGLAAVELLGAVALH